YATPVKYELYDSELMQVILNILKNAQDNFKEKSTQNAYIKITTHDKCITICDNGGGIPNAIIERIFDPYFSTKNEKNGTGLGLYMCKTIIEEHHKGSLHVKSSDKGVCFSIELGDL
ncbi:MAG: HAMP domain-containing sensor histidine kinase, partial [Campylobacterota bacterium]|nr:HAMP domain-containing sensor histidine kinase [Campylobacterota bacterium]